jgi:hypothetical protein
VHVGDDQASNTAVLLPLQAEPTAGAAAGVHDVHRSSHSLPGK